MADVNLTHTGAQLDTAIANVLAGYVDTSSGDASEGDIALGKIAWVDGVEKTGTLDVSIQTKTGTTVVNVSGNIVIASIGFAPVIVSLRIHWLGDSAYSTDVLEYVSGHWYDTWSDEWRNNADAWVSFSGGTLTLTGFTANDTVEYSMYG